MYIFTTSELLLFYLQIKYSMTTNSGLWKRLIFNWWNCRIQLRCCVVLCFSRIRFASLSSAHSLPPSRRRRAGALMESDEVRASSRSPTDRAWIFAWLKKKKSVSARRLTALKFDSCQKASCRWPTCREPPGAGKEKGGEGNKKREKHKGLDGNVAHRAWPAFHWVFFTTAVTVGGVLVRPCEQSKCFVVSPALSCSCCLVGLKRNVVLRLKTF